MTLNTVLTFARTQVQTDSNGLSDATGIVFANEAILDFTSQLIDSGIDAAQVQESYASFTANTGTYSFPSDMWRLKTIELNYRDTTQQNYVIAQQLDIANTPEQTSWDWLRVNAQATQPFFDNRGNIFEVFPTPTASYNLTNAIKIFYFLNPSTFTATSDTIAYPASLDYTILGYRIGAKYMLSLGKADLAQILDTQYQTKVDKMKSTLGPSSQAPIQAQAIPWTGFSF